MNKKTKRALRRKKKERELERTWKDWWKTFTSKSPAPQVLRVVHKCLVDKEKGEE